MSYGWGTNKPDITQLPDTGGDSVYTGFGKLITMFTDLFALLNADIVRATKSEVTAASSSTLLVTPASLAKGQAGGVAALDPSGNVTAPLAPDVMTTTVNKAVLACYPVGSIYMSTNSTSPATLFGGTWTALDQGRVLIGAGPSHPAGETGGSEALQAHTHTASSTAVGDHAHTASGSTSNAGSHTHTMYFACGGNHRGCINAADGSNRDCYAFDTPMAAAGDHAHSFGVTTSGSGAHNHSITVNSAGSGNSGNMQPYLSVFMWSRVS